MLFLAWSHSRTLRACVERVSQDRFSVREIWRGTRVGEFRWGELHRGESCRPLPGCEVLTARQSSEIMDENSVLHVLRCLTYNFSNSDVSSILPVSQHQCGFRILAGSRALYTS